MRHKAPMLAFATLFALNIVGCDTPFDASLISGTTPGAPAPQSVVLTATSPTLLVGQTTQVSAAVKDASGQVVSGAALSWTSNAPAVATVGSNGLVTAVSAGSAVIRAAAGSVVGETTISVSSSPTTPDPGTPTPPVSTAPSPVDLPKSFLETPMPTAPAAGGTVISVSASGDLQAAIDQARPGDVIELASGATYTGNFTLPNKGASSSWIVIRPAASSALPGEGQRMTPQIAVTANLPRIITANNAAAITTALGAGHYRLVGIEVGIAPAQSAVNTLVSLGIDGSGGQTSLSTVAHDIVLDRMYIHGSSTATLRRCVALNSASTAIIDSYLSDCHEKGADSQAIAGWNGPGPFKIVNNYLESAGEVIMFGGSDPSIPNLVPSDIEVRHNHLTRPLSWKGVWMIKNLFELKNASRVLVEGNVMENNWLDGQDGTAINLKSVNQDGSAPWSGTNNVTFRFNIIRNVGSGFSIAANPEAAPANPLHSVSISDNLITNINSSDYNGSSRAFLTQGNITDVSITHNTIVNSLVPFATVVFGPEGAQTVRFVFSNNVSATAENWGVFGDNVAAGTAAMSMYAPTGTLAGNVFAGNIGNNYPAGNFFVPSVAGVGFTDAASGDFNLVSISPFKAKATDGRDPGADMAALLNATAGAK